MAGHRNDDEQAPRTGYLPPRAAARARKIVRRAPMSLAWPVAALVVGLVILAAGASALL